MKKQKGSENHQMFKILVLINNYKNIVQLAK